MGQNRFSGIQRQELVFSYITERFSNTWLKKKTSDWTFTGIVQATMGFFYRVYRMSTTQVCLPVNRIHPYETPQGQKRLTTPDGVFHSIGRTDPKKPDRLSLLFAPVGVDASHI